MEQIIYLDYHATSPVDTRVLRSMLPYFCEVYANPAGSHPASWRAKEAIDKARNQQAEILQANEEEILFTASATEANNLALSSAKELYSSENKKQILVSAIEHKSVIKAAQSLDCDYKEIPVNQNGQIDLDFLEDELKKSKTFLVSVGQGNNEVGSLQDLDAISNLCQKYGALFHCDAVQTFAKFDISIKRTPIDFITWSSHKFYGPKGVGGLYFKKGLKLKAQILGGDHEFGYRAGTLNVAGIVGMAEAATLTKQLAKSESLEIKKLRDQLQGSIESLLQKKEVRYKVNNNSEQRLYNNLSISLSEFKISELQAKLRRICYSTGSSCASGSGSPSHVLLAIGNTDNEARNTFRLSLGRMTTKEEIENTIKIFEQAFT